jgi:hypothetical protein
VPHPPCGSPIAAQLKGLSGTLRESFGVAAQQP